MSDAEQEVEQATAENPEVEPSAEGKVDAGKTSFLFLFFFFFSSSSFFSSPTETGAASDEAGSEVSTIERRDSLLAAAPMTVKEAFFELFSCRTRLHRPGTWMAG